MIEIIQDLDGPEAQLIRKIILAFPPGPPPEDKDLVAADADHLRTCDECRDAQQFFAGKTREGILSDERNYPHLVNAFDFFTPRAWYYYLPAFLIQDVLRGRHRFECFWHHNEPIVIEGHWSSRIAHLNRRQCEVLLDYLESHRSYAIQTGREEELSKDVEWWQRIRQEKPDLI